MGITLDYDEAKKRLAEAVALAKSDCELPPKWASVAAAMEDAPSKTYTPALGAALLARATSDRVDPLSIKEAYGDNTYSLRSLCHGVLVPAAVEYGFSIRNTGREPLNNQPFFRYDHMTKIERVRDPQTLRVFLSSVSLIIDLDRDESLLALAAFLRYRFKVTAETARRKTIPGQLELAGTVDGIVRYIGIGTERPRKAQAIVAACLDLTHGDVRSRRLNDPSRDVPGDVQAYAGEAIPHTAIEVRAKSVSETEVRSFVAACSRAGISRAIIVLDTPSHMPLPATRLRAWAAHEHDMSLTVYESVASFFVDALAWGDRAIEEQLSRFASDALARLQEIEVSDASQLEWIALCDELADTGD